MNIEYMREKISEAYPGVGWKYRCKMMPEKQVIAIYKSFTEKNLFHKRKKHKKQAQQVNMFDYAKSIGVRL